MAWGTEGILVWFFSILDPRLSDWNRFSDYIRKASEITSVKFCMQSYLHKPILQFYQTIGYINIWLLHSQQLMREGDLWSFSKASSLQGTIHNSPQSTTIQRFQVLLFSCPEALIGYQVHLSVIHSTTEKIRGWSHGDSLQKQEPNLPLLSGVQARGVCAIVIHTGWPWALTDTQWKNVWQGHLLKHRFLKNN